MRSLELFSGAGGLAKGLELAGYDHAKFVEFDKNACNSLRKNFSPDLVFEGDVRNFDFGSIDGIDLIAGGPPCQPFSLGGKHRAHEDHRDMFPYAAKAVSHHRPKAFVFENVKGLLRSTFSSYFQYVLLRLTYPEVTIASEEEWQDHYERLTKIKWSDHGGVKYKVSYKLLNAADYGVPQVRERVFIVGIRSDINVEWTFPSTTHSQSVLNEQQQITGEYWERHGLAAPTAMVGDHQMCGKQHSLTLELEPRLKAWRTVRDALSATPHPNSDHGIADHIFRDGARPYAGHTGSYIDLPAKTLKAGGHGVPGGENMIRYEDGTVRYFTVYEGKLLQTFDPSFHVTGAWGEGMRQIGNAVPTLLANKIGDHLMKLIGLNEVIITKAA
ncbi:MAG: DNA (cytosine-5-)-methyltransferase [Phenylobacterium zucineum]|nr:MAG: DNA (cytosine-5-)-methyltransferase [Phenylobacterium zucineum]